MARVQQPVDGERVLPSQRGESGIRVWSRTMSLFDLFFFSFPGGLCLEKTQSDNAVLVPVVNVTMLLS